MSKAKLKKYLQTLPPEHLVQVILDLYEARKDAREYLEFFMNPDVDRAVEKGKKDLYRIYFTPQGHPRPKGSVKSGNDIIADLLTYDIPAEQIADLMVYHVEVVLSRLVMRHIVSEIAWNGAINLFRKTIEYITVHEVCGHTKRRIEKILEYTHYSPACLHVEERMKYELTELNYYNAK